MMNRDDQRRARLDAGLIAHTDRGSQSTSLAYTDRLDELGAAPSVGLRGDLQSSRRRTMSGRITGPYSDCL
jgi:transposase InsO family protein